MPPLKQENGVVRWIAGISIALVMMLMGGALGSVYQAQRHDEMNARLRLLEVNLAAFGATQESILEDVQEILERIR